MLNLFQHLLLSAESFYGFVFYNRLLLPVILNLF